MLSKSEIAHIRRTDTSLEVYRKKIVAAQKRIDEVDEEFRLKAEEKKKDLIADIAENQAEIEFWSAPFVQRYGKTVEELMAEINSENASSTTEVEDQVVDPEEATDTTSNDTDNHETVPNVSAVETGIVYTADANVSAEETYPEETTEISSEDSNEIPDDEAMLPDPDYDIPTEDDTIPDADPMEPVGETPQEDIPEGLTADVPADDLSWPETVKEWE